MMGDDQPSDSAGRRGKRAVSIRTGLLAAMVAVTGAAVVLVYFGAAAIARLNTEELIRDKSDLILRAVEERTRSLLEPIEAHLVYLAEIAPDVLGAEDGASRLVPSLRASLAAAPQVTVVGFATPDLHIVRVFRNRPGRPAEMSDWSDDGHFVRAVAAAQASKNGVWRELFVAEPVGLTYLSLFMPVYRGNRFLGVVVAGVSLAGLSGFVGELDEAYGVRSFILYGQDQVLAHRSLVEHPPAVTDDRPLPSLVDLDDSVLAAIWTAGSAGRAADRLSARLHGRVLEQGGRDYLVTYRTLKGFGPPDWIVGAYTPVADLAPQYGRLGVLPWIAGGVLVAAALIALLVSRALAMPIRRLAEASQRVRQLDLDGGPGLVPGPFRELNEASEAYNTMVCGLRAFEAYVPRQLVLRLMRRDAAEAPGSEERAVTVMFTDIVGFTALAETMPAPRVAALLNEHFGMVDQYVEAEGGIVDKYIGDAVMAFWGAPDDQPDHARRACRAALAVMRALQADNRRRRREGLPLLRLRIGIHSGSVVVGDIGGPGRINYTVIGDTVNIAQRLEGLARDLGEPDEDVVVALSGETAASLDGHFTVARIGWRDVPGRHAQIEVYQLRPDGQKAVRPPPTR